MRKKIDNAIDSRKIPVPKRPHRKEIYFGLKHNLFLSLLDITEGSCTPTADFKTEGKKPKIRAVEIEINQKKRTKKKNFKTRHTSHGKSEFLVFNQNNTSSPLHPPLRVCFFTLSLVRVCQCVLHLIPLMTVPPTGRVRGQSTTHIEGTGTRPDYLVDRDDTNMEGPFGNNTEIEK